MIRRLRRAQEGIHFLDILLDETICEGKILVPEELVRDAGGINEKLQAKQKYELLLRIAQQLPIVLEEISGEESSDGYIILGADEADDFPDRLLCNRKIQWRTRGGGLL